MFWACKTLWQIYLNRGTIERIGKLHLHLHCCGRTHCEAAEPFLENNETKQDFVIVLPARQMILVELTH
ncbi:MAG: hypothetical protein QOE55_6275, partial [Acidobacteriaceae bacterium]|nr:hypothetical protein [Acidobacteriaceae bacterium]